MKKYLAYVLAFLTALAECVSVAATPETPSKGSPSTAATPTVATNQPTAPATFADASNDPLATAGVLVVYLDNSGSSPATDKKFVKSAWPIVEQAIRSMDMGSKVILVSVGDAKLKPMNMSVRIQARDTPEGKTLDKVVKAVKDVVLAFPEQTQGQEHGSSHLVAGFFDAARVINPQSKNNKIVALTDLVEYSDLANCYRDCKKLPAPNFSLPGTTVIALGVGRGLPSSKEMEVFAAWDKFFVATGAKAELKRTF